MTVFVDRSTTFAPVGNAMSAAPIATILPSVTTRLDGPRAGRAASVTSRPARMTSVSAATGIAAVKSRTAVRMRFMISPCG